MIKAPAARELIVANTFNGRQTDDYLDQVCGNSASQIEDSFKSQIIKYEIVNHYDSTIEDYRPLCLALQENMRAASDLSAMSKSFSRLPLYKQQETLKKNNAIMTLGRNTASYLYQIEQVMSGK